MVQHSMLAHCLHENQIKGVTVGGPSPALMEVLCSTCRALFSDVSAVLLRARSTACLLYHIL